MAIKIKMSTEEIGIIREALLMFKGGGIVRFNDYAKQVMRGKYQENWISFYHQSPNYVTKIGINISSNGIPTLSVNRTTKKDNQQQSIWFPLTANIRPSVEILLMSYMQAVFNTSRIQQEQPVQQQPVQQQPMQNQSYQPEPQY